MFVQMKRIVVKEGFAEPILTRFSGEGKIEKQPGFKDMTVLRKKVRRGDEEVAIYIRWNSEEDWKNWEKNPEHIAGHRENRGKSKPEYVLESSQDTYYVHAVK